MVDHQLYIKRCFELAKKATKSIKSNPPVGAVIVYQDRIIGEGYHQTYGEAHAEINALNSVNDSDQSLIDQSTLYVSLEPCSHFGKTPPCSQAIVAAGIKKVVVSCLDPTEKVAGKGIQYLEEHGVHVTSGILAAEGEQLIKRFTINQYHQRPYIILKWAKSYDHYMGQIGKQVWLSNTYTQVHSHQLRSQVDAIMVGSNTILTDNPSLTTRQFTGEHPTRIILDNQGRMNHEHRIVQNDEAPTWIIGNPRPELAEVKHIKQIEWSREKGLMPLLQHLYQSDINHLLIEGGKQTLDSFIKENIWDEAYIYHTPHRLHEGIKSPQLEGYLIDRMHIDDNRIDHISREAVKNS